MKIRTFSITHFCPDKKLFNLHWTSTEIFNAIKGPLTLGMEVSTIKTNRDQYCLGLSIDSRDVSRTSRVFCLDMSKSKFVMTD